MWKTIIFVIFMPYAGAWTPVEIEAMTEQACFAKTFRAAEFHRYRGAIVLEPEICWPAPNSSTEPDAQTGG